METTTAADSVSTLDQLKSVAQAFCEERDWDQFHSPKDLAIGAVTEASELLELFRFKSQEEISSLMERSEFRDRVRHELADIFFFVLRFSQKNKMDLTQAFLEKMRSNAAKYPAERFRGRNHKYNEVP